MTKKPNTIDPRDLGYVCLTEFLASELPTPRTIIHPWLYEGQVAMLHADAGVGKTWFGLTLALIASKHVSCFDYSGPAVPVLYVDGEMGRHDLHARMTKLRDTLKVDLTAGEPFKLLARDLAHEDHLHAFPDLCDPTGQDLICDIAKDMKAGLVVLDNYRTLAQLEDENDATAFQSLNRFLKRLARGRAVIGVHHNNKHSKMSGSTALETVLSHRFNLVKSTPTVVGQACFTLRLEKNRTGLGADAVVPLKCELGSDGWSWSQDNESRLDEFREAAERLEFATQKEAGDRFGVTDKTIRNWCVGLRVRGDWKTDTWAELTGKAKELRAAIANEAEVVPEPVDDGPLEF